VSSLGPAHEPPISALNYASRSGGAPSACQRHVVDRLLARTGGKGDRSLGLAALELRLRRALAGDACNFVARQRRDRVGRAQSLEAAELASEALTLVLVEQLPDAERRRCPIKGMQRLRLILRPAMDFLDGARPVAEIARAFSRLLFRGRRRSLSVAIMRIRGQSCWSTCLRP
jgi:hypothetical protein